MISATATEMRGDRDVVEDLADGFRERPAVGEVHEHAVDRVDQAHPCGEQDRQHENRVERQAECGCAAGEDEQPDLGGGVEPEPEQHPDGVDLPRLADRAGQAAEEAVHEPARVEVLLQLGLVERAAPHPAEHRDDADEHDEVHQAEDPQEHPGHRRPDHPGDRVQHRRVVLDLPGQRLDARRASRNVSANTIVEWPSENQNPTDSGRGPPSARSSSSLRVVLSTAAMWSASNACRSPNV